MAYKIVWIPKAKESFDSIVDYLHGSWNEEVVKSFILNSKDFI
jgi:plasmid stabilization system protein ParE